MATTLPLGIRVAAGLVGTSFDHLVRLPGELPGLTVSFAGQLLRTSLRVRQEIAELANRGDELLAPLIGGAEEHPAWATFDEDEDDGSADGDGDAGSGAAASATTASSDQADGGTDRDVPTNADADDPTRTLVESLGVETVVGRSPQDDGDAPDPADVATEFLDLPADPSAGADELIFTTSTPADSPILADHQLSVAELKDRLPDLDSATVRQLLAQEESGPNRAPYLTLLTNRLTTLEHEDR